jgi:hypothetical protein
VSDAVHTTSAEFERLGIRVFVCSTESVSVDGRSKHKWLEFVDLARNPNYRPRERYCPPPRPSVTESVEDVYQEF